MKLFAKVLFLAVLGLGCQTLYTGAQSPDTKPLLKPTARYPEKAETTKPATRYTEKPAAAASGPAVPGVPAEIFEVQVAPVPPQPPLPGQPWLPPQPPLPTAGARTVRGYQLGMPASPNAPAALNTTVAQSGNGMFLLTVDSQDAEAARLSRQLADAKTDADKDKLKDKIKDLLVKQFDERQKRHEKELEALEAQVKKLKEMVNKRQDNKREIIDERMKQLQRDAQGLGW